MPVPCTTSYTPCLAVLSHTQTPLRHCTAQCPFTVDNMAESWCSACSSQDNAYNLRTHLLQCRTDLSALLLERQPDHTHALQPAARPPASPTGPCSSSMSLSQSHNLVGSLQVQDDTDLSAASCHFVRGVAGDHTRQGSAVSTHMHAQGCSELETYRWTLSVNKQLSNRDMQHAPQNSCRTPVVVTTMRRCQRRSKQTYRK